MMHPPAICKSTPWFYHQPKLPTGISTDDPCYTSSTQSVFIERYPLGGTLS